MATIDQLHTSITKLSPEDGIKLIIKLRTSRRVVKKPVKLAAPKKTSTSKKPVRKLTLTEMANMLTPEQKAQIVKQLLNL